MTENVLNALGASAGGVLAADITSTDTSIQLVAGGGARLPPAPFRLTLTDGSTAGNGVPANAEIIWVGAKSGDSLSSIIREYEISLNGGAARAWTAGTLARHRQTAGMIQSLITSLQNVVTNYWNSSNDGDGSGLDADLLDGHHADDFLLASDYTANNSVSGVARELVISATGSNSTVSVSFKELIVRDALNASAVLNSGSISINSAASGANGLDTGTLDASTWYTVFVISNRTTKAGLLSLSNTAPTLPTGYTYFARVGKIRTDASGNKYPLSFKQQGKKVQPKIAAGSNVDESLVVDSGVIGTWHHTTPTYSLLSIADFVPDTAIAITGALLGQYLNGTPSNVDVAPNSDYGGFASAKPPTATTTIVLSPPPEYAVCNPVVQFTMMLESLNIAVCSQAAGGAVIITGWEDS